MAEDSVKELVVLMSEKKGKRKKTILPTELVIRESCRSL
jgi:DNA-binding LacI/PurR family transcriptional regulator